MKVSLITAVYNNADTLTDTLESVISQSYKNIEYIIVDGLSDDGSLEILERYREHIHKMVSSKDDGLYDALNKGLEMASGDVVGFIHADDIYEDKLVIEHVVEQFLKGNADAVYGNLFYVKEDDTRQVVRVWKSSPYRQGRLKFGWMPPHPTFFVKRSIYRNYGVFDTRFRISGDYDLMLRLLGKHSIKAVYIDKVLIRMREGGKSNNSRGNLIPKLREDSRALRNNGVGSWMTLILKRVRKLGQYYPIRLIFG